MAYATATRTRREDAKARRSALNRAMTFLRQNDCATYAQAANRYGLTRRKVIDAVRYRYGSLEALRSGLFTGDADPDKVRNCIRCRAPMLEQGGRRMCDKCNQQINQYHDGAV